VEELKFKPKTMKSHIPSGDVTDMSLLLLLWGPTNPWHSYRHMSVAQKMPVTNYKKQSVP
jgi:hypothetical protein